MTERDPAIWPESVCGVLSCSWRAKEEKKVPELMTHPVEDLWLWPLERGILFTDCLRLSHKKVMWSVKFNYVNTLCLKSWPPPQITVNWWWQMNKLSLCLPEILSTANTETNFTHIAATEYWPRLPHKCLKFAVVFNKVGDDMLLSWFDCITILDRHSICIAIWEY